MKKKILCAALILLTGLSLALCALAGDESALPAALFADVFVNRGDYSGMAWQFGEDGSFVLSNWRSEDRSGIVLNIYSAQFHGRYSVASRLEGSAIYEITIASIDQVEGRIYDVFYPLSGDLSFFEDCLPYQPGTTLRIVPPVAPGGLCLIGTSNEAGWYFYSEYAPRE